MAQRRCDSFPQFSELPNELKDLIWEAALEKRPAVHFAYLPKVDPVTSKTGTWRGPQRLKMRKAAPPANIPSNRHFTQQEALLHTCQSSRNVVLRIRRTWAPERTIELYGVNRSRNPAFPAGVQSDNAGSLTHGQGQYGRRQKLDGDNSLIILDNDWKTNFSHEDNGQLSIEKVGNLACVWSDSPEADSVRDFIVMVAFPPRCETLYLVFSPDDLELHSVVEPSQAEAPRQDIARTVCTNSGTTRPVPKSPGSFWYGKREYYYISWETVQRTKKPNLQELCDSIKNGFFRGDWRHTGCETCGVLFCNPLFDEWPTAYKALTWRDWD